MRLFRLMWILLGDSWKIGPNLDNPLHLDLQSSCTWPGNTSTGPTSRWICMQTSRHESRWSLEHTQGRGD